MRKRRKKIQRTGEENYQRMRIRPQKDIYQDKLLVILGAQRGV